jgi:lipoprotein-releasing system ATP-binding protein
MITAKNIHYSYGNLKVLKGVDLNIEKGEFVSIIGDSGAGKTTLLQLLGTLDKIQQGSLAINKRETKNLSEKEVSKFRNQEIGFVFQFHNLLNEFTALENICLPAYLNGTAKKDAEKKRIGTSKITRYF